MKPHLVVGLGNTLMGDEGIGCVLAGRLAADPRLPDEVEVVEGGSDLLACAGLMAGRRRVTLLDAILDLSEPGRLHIFEDDFPELEITQSGAHAMSAAAAIRLLQITEPHLREVRFKLIAVAIDSAAAGPGLSPAIAAKVPFLLERVRRELVDATGRDR